MKIFYKVSGLVIIFGCLFFFKRDIEELNTYHHGKLVTAKVVYVPNCIFASDVYYYMKFEYNGQIYSKRIGGKFCDELKEGDTLELIFNAEKGIFLYESENPIIELVSTFIIFFCGVWLVFQKRFV